MNDDQQEKIYSWRRCQLLRFTTTCPTIRPSSHCWARPASEPASEPGSWTAWKGSATAFSTPSSFNCFGLSIVSCPWNHSSSPRPPPESILPYHQPHTSIKADIDNAFPFRLSMPYIEFSSFLSGPVFAVVTPSLTKRCHRSDEIMQFREFSMWLLVRSIRGCIVGT